MATIRDAIARAAREIGWRLRPEPEAIPQAVGEKLLAAQEAYGKDKSADNRARYSAAIDAVERAAFPKKAARQDARAARRR